MSPEEVEQLFKSNTQSEADVDETVNEDSNADKNTKLKEVLQSIQSMWDAGSTSVEQVAEKLGNGSRDGAYNFYSAAVTSSQTYIP
jgi:hypothetical protein